jgi:hypothetical protein
VPNELCREYTKKSKTRKRLAHAYVGGFADPTDAIPSGSVFVTGSKHLAQVTLFVTRSPCIHPSDGRMLPNLTTKPVAMSTKDWEWLNELPFGAIIFSGAEEGMKPLPTFIANGDLDGDLYFVCWDAEILGHVKAEAIVNVDLDLEMGDNGPSDDENWLENAQQLMVDPTRYGEQGQLVGKLYKLASKAADENTELFMNDPDAMAFARAYSEALDYRKHGRNISLPFHLHEKLPLNLRKYLAGHS